MTEIRKTDRQKKRRRQSVYISVFPKKLHSNDGTICDIRFNRSICDAVCRGSKYIHIIYYRKMIKNVKDWEFFFFKREK